jgi:hypothetical protein
MRHTHNTSFSYQPLDRSAVAGAVYVCALVFIMIYYIAIISQGTWNEALPKRTCRYCHCMLAGASCGMAAPATCPDEIRYVRTHHHHRVMSLLP